MAKSPDPSKPSPNKTTYTTPEVWAERYKLASGRQTKLFKKFSNWYDSLYTVNNTVPAPWRSKVYVPLLARQTWALVSKFLALKPGFQVRVAKPEGALDDVDEQASKAQWKLEYDFENPYLDNTMRDKLFAPLLDAVVTGTGLAKVEWCVDEDERYEREVDDEGYADLSKEKKTTKKVSYNNLEPVNIFNVFVSPAATDLYNAPWIMIKEHKTLQELKDKGIYDNLDKLATSSQFDDDFSSYNFSRNRLTSVQDRQDSTIDNIKIYECYEGDTICTYAETSDKDTESGWIKLLERKNPYWFGKYPLVKFHVKKRPFDFWGEGIFETTFRLQSAYNDVYNHFLDQWNLSENSMLMVRENSNVNDYIVEPGGTITYRGDQPPTQFKHAAPDARALETILTYLDQAVEGVTISQYASGQANSATDKTKGTATGILKLQEAAGDVISFMRQNFTQSIVQVGRMWLSNNQQFLDKPVSIVATVKGKKTPMTIGPKDMQGDMELIIDDSTMDPAAQDEKMQREMAYLQEIQQLQQASVQQAQMTKWTTSPLYLDFANIMQDFSLTAGRSQVDKYILPEEEVQKAIQASQVPMIMPNEKWQIDMNQLYGSEAAQLLQRSGVQPDPARTQQTPVMGDAFQARQTGAGGVPPTEGPGSVQPGTPDPSAVTPDHLIQVSNSQHQQELAAQQQMAKQAQDAAQLQHQQGMDVAQAAMTHHKNQQEMALKQKQADQGFIAKLLTGNQGDKSGKSRPNPKSKG